MDRIIQAYEDLYSYLYFTYLGKEIPDSEKIEEKPFYFYSKFFRNEVSTSVLQWIHSLFAWTMDESSVESFRRFTAAYVNVPAEYLKLSHKEFYKKQVKPYLYTEFEKIISAWKIDYYDKENDILCAFDYSPTDKVSFSVAESFSFTLQKVIGELKAASVQSAKLSELEYAAKIYSVETSELKTYILNEEDSQWLSVYDFINTSVACDFLALKRTYIFDDSELLAKIPEELAADLYFYWIYNYCGLLNKLFYFTDPDLGEKNILQSFGPQLIACSDEVYFVLDPRTEEEHSYAKPYLSERNNAFQIFISSDSYYLDSRDLLVSWVTKDELEMILKLSDLDPTLLFALLVNGDEIYEIPVRYIYSLFCKYKEWNDLDNLITVKSNISKIVESERQFFKDSNKKKIKKTGLYALCSIPVIIAIIVLYFNVRPDFKIKDNAIAKYNYNRPYVQINEDLKHPVNGISYGVFQNKKKVEEIVINAPITFISSYAFFGTDSLKTVVLPETLLTIGNNAFSYSGIKEISIPASVNSIGYSTFANTNLKKITVGKNLFETFPEAFESFVNNDDVEIVLIDDSKAFMAITYWDNENAKYNGPKDVVLDYLEIPEGLEVLPKFAFEFFHLEEIVLPDSLKKIEHYAFFYSSDVKKITMGSNIQEIEPRAFYGLSKIEELKFSEGLTVIADNVCRNCDSLKRVIIPASVKEIQAYAFQDCDNLEEIIYFGKIEELKIHPTAFENPDQMVIIVLE